MTPATRHLAVELRRGDRLVCDALAGRSVLVTAEPLTPPDDDVYIDVEVQGHGSWDADDLATIGATAHRFLALNPTPRYRLVFPATAMVTVMDPVEAEAWVAAEEQWRLEPARRAAARGHVIEYTGPHQERFTCTRCGRTATRHGDTLHGAAVTEDCEVTP